MKNVGMYAKFIVSALMAGLTALFVALNGEGGGSVTNAEWVTVALAVVGAIAVYAVPNAPASVTNDHDV